MKMQNTEMEFIAFDAQDVIATSGPFYGQSMTAQIGIIGQYNAGKTDADKLYNSGGSLSGGLDQETHKKDSNWLFYNALQPDTQPVSGATGVTGTLRAAERMAQTTQPEADFVADTIEKVAAWLAVQRMQ